MMNKIKTSIASLIVLATIGYALEGAGRATRVIADATVAVGHALVVADGAADHAAVAVAKKTGSAARVAIKHLP
jgi:hydrogenase maturation factor